MENNSQLLHLHCERHIQQERGSASQLGRGLGGAADDALDLAERGDGAGRHGRTTPRHLGRDGPRLRRAGRLRPVGRQARRRLRGKGKARKYKS